MEKRIVLLLITLFLLNLYISNAQLPEVILNAEVQDNDVILTWNYGAYGGVTETYIKLNVNEFDEGNPLAVSFNVESNFDFNLCQIDYGDSSYDTKYYDDCKNPFQHTYQDSGSYNVALIAEDLQGNSYNDFASVIVKGISSYGSYGFGGSGFSVRNILLSKARNQITGKSFLDDIGDSINGLFRKLFSKP